MKVVFGCTDDTSDDGPVIRTRRKRRVLEGRELDAVDAEACQADAEAAERRGAAHREDVMFDRTAKLFGMLDLQFSLTESVKARRIPVYGGCIVTHGHERASHPQRSCASAQQQRVFRVSRFVLRGNGRRPRQGQHQYCQEKRLHGEGSRGVVSAQGTSMATLPGWSAEPRALMCDESRTMAPEFEGRGNSVG